MFCFQLSCHDGNGRVNKRPTACIPEEGELYGIMVLGAISSSEKSEIICLHGNLIADDFQFQALQTGLLPFFEYLQLIHEVYA